MHRCRYRRFALLLATALSLVPLIVYAEAVTPPPPATAAAAPSLVHIRAAAARAGEYFTRRGLAVEKFDVIMLSSLLQRYFGVQFDFPPVQEFYRRHPELWRKQFQLYHLYFEDRRLPQQSASKTAASLRSRYPNQIDAFTDWSMFCPSFPLPHDFLTQLRARFDKSGYWLTHAGLQLQNARINGCLKNTPEVVAFEREVVERLRRLIDGPEPYDDPRIEAMAILYYMGHGETVTGRDLEWLLARQRPDGGWAGAAQAAASHDHTTILGLWTLLEAERHLRR
ncbi:MAG TPA: hypothetical protein VEB21_11905 [Terriglobales bacterium]|nr:hypothetical protein [Terriglobales bacterium]